MHNITFSERTCIIALHWNFLYHMHEFLYIFFLFMPGNVIDIQTGDWIGKMSGLGAGLDSFYEYLLKVKKDSFFSKI